MNFTRVYVLLLRYCQFAVLCSLAFDVPAKVQASFRGHTFVVEQVASGLGVPWGMAILPNNRLLFTERAGTLKQLKLESGQLSSISGAPKVFAEGQGGLLDIALSPTFKSDRQVYFTYSKEVRGQGATVLARARLIENQLQDCQDLLVTQSRSDTGRHFGSRIAFDESGHVYFSVGDRGVRENAQNTANHAGAILRLNLDGTVPDSNPFVQNGAGLPEIWSFGHRNPQGLVYDRRKQRLWSIEHGPRGGDEINLVQAGKNYGWPVISHGKEYWGPFDVGEGTHREGMESPVKVYVPSIAPGSLLVYGGQAFPEWQGVLFAGALKLRHLNVVTLDEKGAAIAEDRLLKDMEKRIRGLCQGPKGWIYFSTDTGEIYVIRPV